ncbi:unnamed protein product [Calicophoron daubneyi]
MSLINHTELEMDPTEGDSTLAESLHLDPTDTGTTSPKPPLSEIQNHEKENPIRLNGCGNENTPHTAVPMDSQNATLQETNRIRLECGLKPLTKSKISPIARNPHPSAYENERLIRSAVLRLLKTLSGRSLEMIIHAAERQLIRQERQFAATQELAMSQTMDGWVDNSGYDHTHYLDDKN